MKNPILSRLFINGSIVMDVDRGELRELDINVQFALILIIAKNVKLLLSIIILSLK